MFFKRRNVSISTVLICAATSSVFAPARSAENTRLSVSPDKCISLLKGQTCYQKVKFRWNVQGMKDADDVVCLWREGTSEALTCWEGESKGEFRYNLESTETTNFHLVMGRQQKPIIDSAAVKISWVYDNRTTRRSRWRLF